MYLHFQIQRKVQIIFKKDNTLQKNLKTIEQTFEYSFEYP